MPAMRGNPLIQRSSRQPRLSRRSEIRQGQANQLVSGYLSHAPMLRQMADIRATNLQEWDRFGQQQGYDLQLRNQLVVDQQRAGQRLGELDRGAEQQRWTEWYRTQIDAQAQRQAEAQFAQEPIAQVASDRFGFQIRSMEQLKAAYTLEALRDTTQTKEGRADAGRIVLAAIARDDKLLEGMGGGLMELIAGAADLPDAIVLDTMRAASKVMEQKVEFAQQVHIQQLKEQGMMARAQLRVQVRDQKAFEKHIADLKTYTDWVMDSDTPRADIPREWLSRTGGPLSMGAFNAVKARWEATQQGPEAGASVEEGESDTTAAIPTIDAAIAALRAELGRWPTEKEVTEWMTKAQR